MFYWGIKYVERTTFSEVDFFKSINAIYSQICGLGQEMLNLGI